MKVVALAGGVGGAKVALGLARNLPEDALTVIVNTGDDFEHLGLRICPDLDTVCYTLAGLANQETGWGRADESWHALEMVGLLGGPTWFKLGDRDLGLHLERTRWLNSGNSLSDFTRHFCQSLGLMTGVLPMSDQKIATRVLSSEGVLPFQDYFVKRKCEPRVRGFIFDGIDTAEPTPGALEAIRSADLVILCPSNPWVSIDPILAVPGIKDAILQKPVLAVSPLIGGQAVKGPAAKMYRELGLESTARAVAKHYRDILDAFMVDTVDHCQEEEIESMGIRCMVADIWMKNIQDQINLANKILVFGRELLHGAKE